MSKSFRCKSGAGYVERNKSLMTTVYTYKTITIKKSKLKNTYSKNQNTEMLTSL